MPLARRAWRGRRERAPGPSPAPSSSGSQVEDGPGEGAHFGLLLGKGAGQSVHGGGEELAGPGPGGEPGAEEAEAGPGSGLGEEPGEGGEPVGGGGEDLVQTLAGDERHRDRGEIEAEPRLDDHTGDPSRPGRGGEGLPHPSHVREIFQLDQGPTFRFAQGWQRERLEDPHPALAAAERHGGAAGEARRFGRSEDLGEQGVDQLLPPPRGGGRGRVHGAADDSRELAGENLAERRERRQLRAEGVVRRQPGEPAPHDQGAQMGERAGVLRGDPGRQGVDEREQAVEAQLPIQLPLRPPILTRYPGLVEAPEMDDPGRQGAAGGEGSEESTVVARAPGVEGVEGLPRLARRGEAITPDDDGDLRPRRSKPRGERHAQPRAVARAGIAGENEPAPGIPCQPCQPGQVGRGQGEGAAEGGEIEAARARPGGRGLPRARRAFDPVAAALEGVGREGYPAAALAGVDPRPVDRHPGEPELAEAFEQHHPVRPALEGAGERRGGPRGR